MDRANNKRKPKPTELGMLAGIILGAGIASIFFIMTENALSFTLIGFTLVIGLIIGHMLEKRNQKAQIMEKDQV